MKHALGQQHDAEHVAGHADVDAVKWPSRLNVSAIFSVGIMPTLLDNGCTNAAQ